MSWEVGLSTGIAYRHPIGDVFGPIAESGLRLVEISTAPHHLDLDRLDRLPEVRRQLDAFGLRVISLHAPFGHDVNITVPDPVLRRRSFERLFRAADALKLLGGRLYVIHPGGEDQRWVWDRDTRLALSVEGLTRVWEACRERGLLLVVETPLPHLLGGQPADFDWILARLPEQDTGVCLDTSHTSLGGFLLESIERLGPRLVHIQASDNRGATDDHLPPGQGIINWPPVLAMLERVTYRGVFMLEVAGNGDVRSHVQRAAAAARRLLGERAPA